MKRRMLMVTVMVAQLLLSEVSSAANRSLDPPKEGLKAFSEKLHQELNESELSLAALENALKGYFKLLEENPDQKTHILTVIDLSKSSNTHRFFLIHLEERRILHTSVVAHGRNSGNEFAQTFSNEEGSYKSSLGFYKTAETYMGKHGLSLRLDGLEKSNSNARKRAIVIHAADYASPTFISKYGRLGRSLGCPSLPKKDYKMVIDHIKNGSLLFIYHPQKQYLENSEILGAQRAL